MHYYFLYIVLEAISANTSSLSDIMFPNTNNTYDVLNSIEIPASFIRHRSISTGKLLQPRPAIIDISTYHYIYFYIIL